MSHPSLSRLSDHALTNSLQRLVSDERRRLVEILEHLNEVERRKLHLEMGHGSLYDYCVNGLRYSRSAAHRRIAAARVLRRFPEVAAVLTAGDVSLTTVSMIARLMTPANGHAMLARIHGKSQRETERIVEEYRPETRTRDRVRAVSVRERVDPEAEPQPTPLRATPGAGSGAAQMVKNTRNENTVHHSASAGSTLGETSGTPESTAPGTCATSTLPSPGDAPLVAIVQKHEIRFIASKDFMKKVERMKALLSNRTPHANLERVFNAAMECYLEHHCPERRHQRRKRRNTSTKKARGCSTGRSATTEVRAGASASTVDRPPSRSLPAPGVAPTRQIPAGVRDAVHARDGGRCTFAGPGGHRCNSRHHLQIDHIVPYALGGGHEPSNLRLLCRAHNLLAAGNVFGREMMTRYMRRE